MQAYASPAASMLSSAMLSLSCTLQGRALWTNTNESHGLLLDPPHPQLHILCQEERRSNINGALISHCAAHSVWSA